MIGHQQRIAMVASRARAHTGASVDLRWGQARVWALKVASRAGLDTPTLAGVQSMLLGARALSCHHPSQEVQMILEDRRDVERDIEETLGLVPEFMKRVPDRLLPTEWASFKNLELADDTAIPNKYKEMIGLAVSGATRCRYCAYFHAEAARMFGATEEEIVETAMIAKNTMGWSTYLNTLQFDYDEFVREFDQIVEHAKAAAAAPA
jgi:AhpD family alkylhydroperoxidase